jgi:hypothetical protein
LYKYYHKSIQKTSPLHKLFNCASPINVQGFYWVLKHVRFRENLRHTKTPTTNVLPEQQYRSNYIYETFCGMWWRWKVGTNHRLRELKFQLGISFISCRCGSHRPILHTTRQGF